MERGRTVRRHAHERGGEQGLRHDLSELPSIHARSVFEAKWEPSMRRAWQGQWGPSGELAENVVQRE
jgi:hypothetical protein